MLTFMTRAQAAGPILTVQLTPILTFRLPMPRSHCTLCPSGVEILFLIEKSTVWCHQEGLTSRPIENSHPVVYSQVDNKVFKFDAT